MASKESLWQALYPLLHYPDHLLYIISCLSREALNSVLHQVTHFVKYPELYVLSNDNKKKISANITTVLLLVEKRGSRVLVGQFSRMQTEVIALVFRCIYEQMQRNVTLQQGRGRERGQLPPDFR